MEKKNRKSTLALWGILITAGLVLAGIELLSGVKHWSVIPTGKGAIDQAISPDETLLVVLNAGENSLSFVDLKTKIPFNKLYLPLEPLLPPAEGETPSYALSSIEFSGDGSELLVTCVDGRFFVIDPVLQEVLSTGKALEPGLTLLGKGKVGKGVFALDPAIGKLSLLGASGEVPVVLTQVPLVASAIDFTPKTTCGSCREFLVTFAYQVEGSGRLSLVEVDSSSLEVTQELSVILPAGATFGDIRRGDEGSIVSVTYLDGSFDFLWVNNDGTIEEEEGEPLPGPEGEKVFRLCKSGMYLAHLDKGLFTLLTYDKDAKPLRLDMAPGGFDGAELRSMSAYPEQADSFASAIGPHEMLLGVPGWEGVVVFDSSGQMILGFGNNNNTTPCACLPSTPPFDVVASPAITCIHMPSVITIQGNGTCNCQLTIDPPDPLWTLVGNNPCSKTLTPVGGAALSGTCVRIKGSATSGANTCAIDYVNVCVGQASLTIAGVPVAARNVPAGTSVFVRACVAPACVPEESITEATAAVPDMTVQAVTGWKLGGVVNGDGCTGYRERYYRVFARTQTGNGSISIGINNHVCAITTFTAVQNTPAPDVGDPDTDPPQGNSLCVPSADRGLAYSCGLLGQSSFFSLFSNPVLESYLEGPPMFFENPIMPNTYATCVYVAPSIVTEDAQDADPETPLIVRELWARVLVELTQAATGSVRLYHLMPVIGSDPVPQDITDAASNGGWLSEWIYIDTYVPPEGGGCVEILHYGPHVEFVLADAEGVSSTPGDVTMTCTVVPQHGAPDPEGGSMSVLGTISTIKFFYEDGEEVGQASHYTELSSHLTGFGAATGRSCPRPVVLLSGLSNVLVDRDAAIVPISGVVLDAVADLLVPVDDFGEERRNYAAAYKDIKKVVVMASGMAPVEVSVGANGGFGPKTVRVPLRHGDNIVSVSACNVLGNSGTDSVKISAILKPSADPYLPGTYSVVDLGTLSAPTGNPTLAKYSISEGGMVCGESDYLQQKTRGFVYVDANGNGVVDSWEKIYLEPLAFDTSRGYGVNSDGAAVGVTQVEGGNTHGFVYTTGIMEDLGTLGGPSSKAYAINSSWAVVGVADTESESHAFMIDSHMIDMIDLGTLGGGFSCAYDISDCRIVVGEASTGTQNHAFLFYDSNGNGIADAGEMVDLGTLNEVSGTSRANAVVDIMGMVYIVGQAQHTVGVSSEHAFLYKKDMSAATGTMVDLGTLGGTGSRALGVSCCGVIVGEADAPSGQRAFVMVSPEAGGTMIDLNTRLVPESSGWVLLRATGINSAGCIVGIGTLNGQYHGFLLKPADEGGEPAFEIAGVENLTGTDAGSLVPIRARIYDPRITEANVSQCIGLVEDAAYDHDSGYFFEELKWVDGHPELAYAMLINWSGDHDIAFPDGVLLFENLGYTELGFAVGYKFPGDEAMGAGVGFAGVTCASLGVEGRIWEPWLCEAPKLKLASGTSVALLIGSPTIDRNKAYGATVVPADGMTIGALSFEHVQLDDSYRLKIPLSLSGSAHVQEAPTGRDLRIREVGADRDSLIMKGCLQAEKLKIVILAVDGLQYDSFRNVYSFENTRWLYRMLGENPVGYDTPAHSCLPTVTWCNWPGILSGLAPKDHGCNGNSFFPREIQDAKPFFSAHDKPGLTGEWWNQAMLVPTAGMLNTLAKEDVGSLYDIIGEIDPTIVARSVHMLFTKRKTGVTHVALTEQWYRAEWGYKGHNPGAAQNLDNDTVRDFTKTEQTWTSGQWSTISYIETQDTSDVVALYFPGVDNISHYVGSRSKEGWTGGLIGGVPPCQKEWLERRLEWNFAAVYQEVAAEGRLAGTLFALVADHGLVGYENNDRHNLHAEDDNGKEFQMLLENMGSNLWRGGDEDIGDRRCVFSPNGGMAHVYVRKSEGGTWPDPPPLDGVPDLLATRIWLEAMGERGIAYPDDILLPEMENCLGEVPLLLVRCDPQDSDSGSFDYEYWWLKEVVFNENQEYESRYGSVDEIPSSALPDPTVFREQLADMKDVRSGDIVMIMNSREGFGAFIRGDQDDGWHGGISMGETAVPMVFGMPYVTDTGFISEGYAAGSSGRPGYQPNYRFAHILKEIVRANRSVE